MKDNLNQQKPIEVMPGFDGRFVHSDKITLAFWKIQKGSKLPLHHHPHEQTTHVISGELELVINGKKEILKAGDLVVIPSDVPHEGVAITDCEVNDTFTPCREDYRDLR